jgi:hypothetical protein
VAPQQILEVTDHISDEVSLIDKNRESVCPLESICAPSPTVGILQSFR